MIRRPFVPLSVRDKLLRLLIKALMAASNTVGFQKPHWAVGGQRWARTSDLLRVKETL
jgi:hypothetical protein